MSGLWITLGFVLGGITLLWVIAGIDAIAVTGAILTFVAIIIAARAINHYEQKERHKWRN